LQDKKVGAVEIGDLMQHIGGNSHRRRGAVRPERRSAEMAQAVVSSSLAIEVHGMEIGNGGREHIQFHSCRFLVNESHLGAMEHQQTSDPIPATAVSAFV
jgi:hypothetical protein